jgi:cell division protease FtsH
MNDEQEPKGNPLLRNMAIWSAIIVALLLLASMFSGTSETAKGISYSTFREKVEAGEVKSVAIAPERITGKFQNEEIFATVPVPGDSGLYPLLDEKGVDVQGKAVESPSLLQYLLIQALPFMLILGIAFFVLRQMQKGGGAGGAMGFGKSKAKLLTEKHGRVTFEDVAGIDEAREELQEIVEFLKDPQKFSRLGGKICWSVRPAPARRYSRAQLPARQAFRFSQSRALTLSKCSSALARAACATCSSKRRKTHLVSSSSTKSMPLAAAAAQV